MIVVFRCDANKNIGVGHVKRSFALAEALRQEDYQVYLLCEKMPASVLNKWSDIGAGIEIIDSTDLSKDALKVKLFLKEKRANWVIVDGYKFNEEYFASIKSPSTKTFAVIDSVQNFKVDCVLNQSPGSSAKDYPKGAAKKYLLGEQFIMLRQEFRDLVDERAKIKPDSIVITMGGSDAEGMTATAVDLLQKNFPQVNLDVVVGPANPFKEELNMSVVSGRWNAKRVNIIVDPDNIAEIFSRNYLAVFAAGSTSWELAALGVPGLCVTLADNQVNVAKTLEEKKFAVNLGWYNFLDSKQFIAQVKKIINDPKLYGAMSTAGRALVDGKGVYRIIRELSMEERMVSALLIGRKGSLGFPHKNTYPVAGHPLAWYPMMAARNSKSVDKVFISTDDENLFKLAKDNDVEIIERPAHLATKEAKGEDAFVHGYHEIVRRAGPQKIIVLLHCNSATITAKMITDGIAILRKHPEYDSAVSVSRYNMWSPIRARKIDKDGLLKPFVPFENFGDPKTLNCDRDSQGDVYFADMGVSIVRPHCLENIHEGLLPQKWMGQKIYPLIQEGGCDVDYEFQMPQTEFWIKKHIKEL